MTPGLRGRVEVVVGAFDLGLEGFVAMGKVDEVVLSGMSVLIAVGFVGSSTGGLGDVILGFSGSETWSSSEPSSLES